MTFIHHKTEKTYTKPNLEVLLISSDVLLWLVSRTFPLFYWLLWFGSFSCLDQYTALSRPWIWLEAANWECELLQNSPQTQKREPVYKQLSNFDVLCNSEWVSDLEPPLLQPPPKGHPDWTRSQHSSYSEWGGNRAEGYLIKSFIYSYKKEWWINLLSERIT